MSREGRDPCTMLEAAEIAAVVFQACAFHEKAKAAGQDSSRICVKDNGLTREEQRWLKEAHGALGEHALAKYLGRFHEPQFVRGTKQPDIGPFGQVRATKFTPGHLTFFQNERTKDGDQDEHAFVLVTLESHLGDFGNPETHKMRAIIRGWLWGEEVKSKGIREKFESPGAKALGRTGWWAEAKDLSHIDSLPDHVWRPQTKAEKDKWTMVR